jgi:hypothetical protein
MRARTHKGFWVVAAAVAALGSPCRASDAEAATQVMAMGKPVMEVRATSKNSHSNDWESASVDLRLIAMASLPGHQIGFHAGLWMSQNEGLSQDKADRFANQVSSAFGQLDPGQVVNARCAPNYPLILMNDKAAVAITDRATAHAFCASWLSKNGNEDLRRGLGLR